MPAQQYTHGLSTAFTTASRMYLGKSCWLRRQRSCGCGGGLRAVGHASVPRKHAYEQKSVGDGDARSQGCAQIFHQDVKELRPTFRAVYSAQHR